MLTANMKNPKITTQNVIKKNQHKYEYEYFTHLIGSDHEMKQIFFNFVPPMVLIYCCIGVILRFNVGK